MKPTAPLALALCLTLPLAAYAQAAKPAPFTDPANLAGERVTPLNGHELPIDQNTLGLAELLRKLNTRASILNIVAHPDDEDGGMLTLYARGLGARVADLALTRGEGGQNFVTGDFEDALGLIRTQELLANDRYTGVTQMFGTEVDFGFSKTREESFQKWGHQRVLYDVVRAIRITRPLVITATFIGNVTDGHGQHQVSGEIAQEAFKAAADPNVFPELTAEGILPWQALKVYARVPFASIDSKGVYDYATNEYVPARFTNYVTGAVTTTKPNADITVPEGDTDPLLTAASANASDIPATLAAAPTTPLSYMQFARIGLSLQRSQVSRNMTLPTSGAHNSGYTLYGSVLCNAPANARDPNITPQTCHPQQAPSASVAALKGRGFSPAVTNANLNRALAPEGMHPSPQMSVILSEADRASASSAAEEPAIHPTTHTAVILSGAKDPRISPAAAQKPVILSEADRASASSAAEGPAVHPTTQTAVILSGAKDPRISPAAAQKPVILSGAARASASSAAEEPAIHPTTHTAVILSGAKDPRISRAAAQKPVILSGAARAFASSAVEGPRTNPAPTLLLTNFHPPTPDTPTTNLSSRPERSEVERPLYLNAAYSPTNRSAQPTTIPAPNEATTPTDLTTNPTFFTGIDTSIEGIATLAPHLPQSFRAGLRDLSGSIARATLVFEATHSPRSQQNELGEQLVATPLAAALKIADALTSGIEASSLPKDEKANVLHELRIKRVQLNDALILALGLRFDAKIETPSSDNIPEHTEVKVTTSLSELGPNGLQLLDQYVQVEPPQTLTNGPFQSKTTYGDDFLHPGVTEAGTLSPLPKLVTPVTQPYFYRDNIEQPIYKLRDPALRSAPQTPAPLTAWATVTYQGVKIQLARIVHDGPQPISIIPPVSIASAPSATVLPNLQPAAQIIATLTTQNQTSANVNVQSPKGWFIQAKATSPKTIEFFLHSPTTFTDPATFHLTATTPDHHAYTEGWRAVGYPGLILTNDYTPATTRVVPVDLKLPEHDRIAYLPGTGDAVPEALASIGLPPTLITVADLTPSKLSSFDTVVLGVRTYSAHPDLQGAPTKALLDFARNGGNVVVQYQTSDFTSADAPYPLDLGPGAKVVVETDPVELLTPGTSGHEGSRSSSDGPSSLRGTNGYPEASASGLIGPAEKGVLTPGYALLNVPNKITPADFNNWIEERGHGFLETWDPHYTALTDTHDPGGDGTLPQPPQRGGLITTQLGPNPEHQGRWTYVAFALYRQLPEAVPGAFRILVNLVTPPTH